MSKGRVFLPESMILAGIYIMCFKGGLWDTCVCILYVESELQKWKEIRGGIHMSRTTKRNAYRERFLREVLFGLFTIILILGISFFVCGTVVSQAEGGVTVDEQYYQVLEKEYVKEIREYLAEQGYENSGVNLTMMIDEEGNRRYSVEVYHKGICKLPEAEQVELFAVVEAMAFDVVGCSFEISLLI